jgi:phosphatidylglycerophosphate synthase
MSSTFGALFDSVLDRYSELILFLGICYYLVAHHYFLSSLFAFIALTGSMMVSYTRARAEGLGIECKGGLMQRPERIILIGVSAVACGIISRYIGGNYKLFIPGIPFHIFETMSIFTIPMVIMAVLTNITAINRLRDAKKALDAKDAINKKVTASPKQSYTSSLLAILLLSVSLFTGNRVSGKDGGNAFPVAAQDTFPVPQNIPGLMFYIQRTPNTNTICYELNLSPEGILNSDDPIHIFWLRYATENGKRKELNFIQRKFAYGLKVKMLRTDNYEVRSVAYPKKEMYLRKATDSHYYVYTTIGGSLAVLKRIFINIDGGSFWSPNVTYIELKGIDVVTGASVSEKIKP